MHHKFTYTLFGEGETILLNEYLKELFHKTSKARQKKIIGRKTS